MRKKIRLVDIALEAGVSMVTVAKVLNSTGGKNARVSVATAAKIREIATRLNYRPDLIAQQLAGKKSGVIGVVMDTCAPQTYHERLSLMELYAVEKDYRFMIGQANNDVAKIKEYAQFFSGYGVDGIICMAHAYPGKSHEIASFFLSQKKTVFFEQPEGIPDAYSVMIDVADNYYQGVKYLWTQGRRRIGLFRIKDFFANPVMNICQDGYERGLKAVGADVNPDLIRCVPVSAMKDVEAGLSEMKTLIKKGIDAVICVNDYMAAVAIYCLQELGVKVPEQVAVVGSDNLDIATLVKPTITTFEQHNDQVAVALVDQIQALIDDVPLPPEKQRIIIKPTFIRRNSA